MRNPRIRPPAPDVILRASFEANGRNLNDCTNITYGQMWERYKAVYAGYYTEWELRRIHDRWKKTANEVWR